MADRSIRTSRPPGIALSVLATLVASSMIGAVACASTPELLTEGRPATPTFDARLQVEPRNGLLVVPVRVGDRELRFLLDSGAPTAITPALRRELGLRARSRTAAADARGTETRVDVVRLPRVTVAGVAFDGIAAVVLDVSAVPVRRCLGVEGLLVANLMRQAAWQIDARRGRLRLANRVERLDIPAGSFMARFITQDSGAPLVRPLLDGVPVPDMVLDTGANVGLLAPTSALESIDGQGTRPRLRAQGSSGAAALGYGPLTGTAQFVSVRRIELGQLRLTDRLVQFRDGASLLGTRFLRDYLVTLDWRGRAVWLTPQPALPASDPVPGFGFEVIPRGDRLVVSLVLVDSPAWDAGLRPGHTILSVDDESLHPLGESRYCDILMRGLVPADRDELRLVFRSEDGQRSVRLRRAGTTAS